MNTAGIDNLQDFFVSFFSRLPVIRRIFVFLVVSTLFYTVFFMPKAYTISGEIIVLSKEIVQIGTDTLAEKSRTQYLPVSLKDMETEATILRSPALLRRTVSILRDEGKFTVKASLLDTWVAGPLRTYIISPLQRLVSENFKDSGVAENEANAEDPELTALTKMVVASLEIAPLPGTSVITVNFETQDIELGRNVVNQLMADYLSMRSDLMNSASLENVFLQKKQLYKERFEQLGNDKLALFNEYEIHSPKEELSLILGTLNAETVEFNKLSVTLLETKERLAYLQVVRDQLAHSKAENITIPYSAGSGFSGTNKTSGDSEIFQQLEKLRNIRSKYEQAFRTFNEDALQVIQPYEQLVSAKKQLMQIVRDRIVENRHDVRVLESLLREKKSRLQEFKQRASLYTEMAIREAEINVELEVVSSALYRYSQQYEEQSSESVINQKRWRNVKILSNAPYPLKSSSPKKSIVVVVAVISSAVASVCIGLLCELFDQRFQNHVQASRELDLHVFAVIDDVLPSNIQSFSLHPLRFFKWLTQKD